MFKEAQSFEPLSAGYDALPEGGFLLRIQHLLLFERVELSQTSQF